MPKVDITASSKNSGMPEFKKGRSKERPKSKVTDLNATSYHHTGDIKVSEDTSSETPETEEKAEAKSESIIVKEPVEQPTKTEEELDIEENENEPELIDDLDNFETKEEEVKDFDLEIKEEKMPKKSKKGKKKPGKVFLIICKIIFFLYSLTGIILLSIVLSLGALPEKYVAMLIGCFVFTLILFAVFTFLKKFRKIAKTICMLFEVILIILFCITFYYVNETTGFLNGIFAKSYQIEEYYVIVKADSEFEKSEDLNGHVIATYENTSENYKNALEEFAKKSTAEQKSYTDSSEASFAFLRNETDALFLKGSLEGVIEEIVNERNTKNPDEKLPTFDSKNIKIIDIIEIKIEVKTTNTNTDLSSESFNVFISGIDTFGDISAVSRSDVNMIATVNPKEHKILLTSIPRDYYVQLHGTTGLKDKLTHAGMFGIDMSRETIEDLFGIDIQYYVRVNFSSVVNIVNAIGGITINSDATLNLNPAGGIGKYCSYSYGENYVDGDCALRFARERHSYADGDNHRIKNQQEVLDAIIKKVSSSKTIISNYSKLLSAFSDNLETNIPTNQIYKLVNRQLDEMPSWSVERITVDGPGVYDYTYSFPSQLLYVAIPDENTVNTARKAIYETLGKPEPEPLQTENTAETE